MTDLLSISEEEIDAEISALALDETVKALTRLQELIQGDQQSRWIGLLTLVIININQNAK